MRDKTENIGRDRYQLLVGAREWARAIGAHNHGTVQEVRVEYGTVPGLDDVVVITHLGAGPPQRTRIQVKHQSTPLAAGHLTGIFRSFANVLDRGENARVVLAIRELVTVDGLELRTLRELARRMSQPGTVASDVLLSAFQEELEWLAWLVRETGLSRSRLLTMLNRFRIEVLGDEDRVRLQLEDALRHMVHNAKVAGLLLESAVMRTPDGAVSFDMALAETVLQDQLIGFAPPRAREEMPSRNPRQGPDAAPIGELVGVVAAFEIDDTSVACVVSVRTNSVDELRETAAGWMRKLRNDPRTPQDDRGRLLRGGAIALTGVSSGVRERAVALLVGRDWHAYVAFTAGNAHLASVAHQVLADRLDRKRHPITRLVGPGSILNDPALTRCAMTGVDEADAILLLPTLFGTLVHRASTGDIEEGYRLARPWIRLGADIGRGAYYSRAKLW